VAVPVQGSAKVLEMVPGLGRVKERVLVLVLVLVLHSLPAERKPSLEAVV
jgi:hypothetical protein